VQKRFFGTIKSQARLLVLVSVSSTCCRTSGTCRRHSIICVEEEVEEVEDRTFVWRFFVRTRL